MNENRQNVYAIGVGPGKTGTTWLFQQLNAHDEVSTCKVKEPYFFTENFHLGFQWYKALFSDQGHIKLEISNRYIFQFEKLVRNLKKFDERVLIIYFDRDPYDRARSAYLFEKQMGQVKTVDEFFNHQKIMEFSKNKLQQKIGQLESDFDVFRVEFERLKFEPQNVLDEICRKLDIATIEYDSNLEKNPSLEPRSKLLSAISKNIARLLRRLRLFRTLQTIKNSKAIKTFLFKNQAASLTTSERDFIDRLIASIDER